MPGQGPSGFRRPGQGEGRVRRYARPQVTLLKPSSARSNRFKKPSPSRLAPPDLYGEVFARFYDRYFDYYAERAAPVLLRFFAALPFPLKRFPVLDLGCGTGRLALHFLEAGYEFRGMDLSPFMLRLAEDRCARFLPGGQGAFVRGDISKFQIGETFSMVLSTYNALNHLDSEEKLRGCFRSARRCLTEGGPFLFDLHTEAGLRAWASHESAQWEDDKVECQGSFDGSRGMAIMLLQGVFEGQPFEQVIVNRAHPLNQVARWLREDGYDPVDYYRMDDLGKPLSEPERENRVVVVAGRTA